MCDLMWIFFEKKFAAPVPPRLSNRPGIILRPGRRVYALGPQRHRLNCIVYLLGMPPAGRVYGGNHRRFRSIGDLSFRKDHNRETSLHVYHFRFICTAVIYPSRFPIHRPYNNYRNWQNVYDVNIVIRRKTTFTRARVCVCENIEHNK